MPVCGEARKNAYVVNFRCGQHGVFEAIRKAEPKLLSVSWEMIALRGVDNTMPEMVCELVQCPWRV